VECDKSDSYKLSDAGSVSKVEIVMPVDLIYAALASPSVGGITPRPQL
jgi:hypothetical protein